MLVSIKHESLLCLGGFQVDQATINVASTRLENQDNPSITNLYCVILFASDTFGFLAPDFDELLKRLQRVIDSVSS